MNCSGLQHCLENSWYFRVLGSTPTFSANKWVLSAMVSMSDSKLDDKGSSPLVPA